MRPLSPRQLEIVALITDGLTNREIGERLGIEMRTVEVHRLNVHRRLGVHNVAQLMRVAYRRNLVEKPSRSSTY